MSSPEPTEQQPRSVSPFLSGMVPILTLGVCVGIAYLAGRAIDGPSWLPSVFVIIGAGVGYYVSRAILRWLFTPR